MQSADGSNAVTIRLDIVDLIKKEAEENSTMKNDQSDVVSGLIESMYSLRFPSYGCFPGKSKSESKTSFTEEVKDVIALQIFGLLIQYKQAERAQLLKKLSEYGFNVKS